MFGYSQSPLSRATLFSVLLHLVILFGVPASFSAGQKNHLSGPLMATLMIQQGTGENLITASPEELSTVSASKHPVAKRTDTPRKPEHRPRIVTDAPATSFSLPPEAIDVPPSESFAKAEGVLEDNVPVQETGLVLGDSFAALDGISGARVGGWSDHDGDNLHWLNESLRRSVERFRHYPRLARERGWEGTAQFTISYMSTQSAPKITLTRSSGYKILDDQGQEMIRRALNVTPLPDDLKGRDFHLPPLGIEFVLQDW